MIIEMFLVILAAGIGMLLFSGIFWIIIRKANDGKLNRIKTLGEFLIPVSIFLFGLTVNYSIQSRDTNLKEFEIALNIINNIDSTKITIDREQLQWALKVFHRYTGKIPGIASKIVSKNIQSLAELIKSDTTQLKGTFHDTVSGMSMEIHEILLDSTVIRAKGRLARPSQTTKDWGSWKLPNIWWYSKTDNELYGIVVDGIQGNNNECIISVYRLY